MNILGLDIATTTGWSIISDGKLDDYGVITIPSSMNLYQKLSYFENNLRHVLWQDIDYCCIEDVILGVSGVKTLSYLSRLNGIALLTCYNKVKDNIKLYTPTYWKSNSFDGLTGKAQKVEVLLAVCKKFNLIKESGYDKLVQKMNGIQSYVEGLQITLKTAKDHQNRLKRELDRKRNPLTDYERKVKTESLEITNKQIEQFTKDLKNSKKKVTDDYNSVAMEITAKCGLTTDVSDSIGIAMCGYLEIMKNGVQN